MTASSAPGRPRRIPRISLEPDFDIESRDSIVDALDAHNMAVTGIDEWQPVNVILRGDDDVILGAALGHVWGGWLQVTCLFIEKGLRGRGHGSRLLAAAESLACSNGANSAALETHSFQARAFYERRGYRTVGEIPDYPTGHTKYFLTKPLFT